MKINKRSSRDANLYVFSHEHHHALIFASRLKKAAKTDAETIGNYIRHFWKDYLHAHFENEERYLLPHLTDKTLKTRLLDEHKLIKNTVEQVQQRKENPIKIAETLAELIRNHVKFEEKLLFPWIQQHLTGEQLGKIGQNLQHIRITADDFSPAFWE